MAAPFRSLQPQARANTTFCQVQRQRAASAGPVPATRKVSPSRFDMLRCQPSVRCGIKINSADRTGATNAEHSCPPVPVRGSTLAMVPGCGPGGHARFPNSGEKWTVGPRSRVSPNGIGRVLRGLRNASGRRSCLFDVTDIYAVVRGGFEQSHSIVYFRQFAPHTSGQDLVHYKRSHQQQPTACGKHCITV